MTSEITGEIGRGGPLVRIRFALSHKRAEELRARGVVIPDPEDVVGLIDTGAQGSSLDSQIIARLGLVLERKILLVTNTSDPNGEIRNQYLSLATLGADSDDPLTKSARVIEADFVGRGFQALIGRDLLQYCIFTYDGPGERFTLSF